MAEQIEDVLRYRLREAREVRGWSQARLAEEAGGTEGGFHQTTIAKIEQGGGKGRRVAVDELVALAAALDVSPVALLLPNDEQATLDLGPMEVEQPTAVDWMLGRRRLREQPVLDLTGEDERDPTPAEMAETLRRLSEQMDRLMAQREDS